MIIELLKLGDKIKFIGNANDYSGKSDDPAKLSYKWILCGTLVEIKSQ
jgi:hypothetical protein